MNKKGTGYYGLRPKTLYLQPDGPVFVDDMTLEEEKIPATDVRLVVEYDGRFLKLPIAEVVDYLYSSEAIGGGDFEMWFNTHSQALDLV